jgi:hypothetical protein
MDQAVMHGHIGKSMGGINEQGMERRQHKPMAYHPGDGVEA